MRSHHQISVRRLLQYFFTLSVGQITQAFAYPSPSSDSRPSITWSTFPDNNSSSLQRGQVAVPIDYSKPGGEKINLTIARLKASGTPRLGSLIFNPGGPGGAATAAVLYAVQGLPIFSPELLAHYDIIGLDPRGVGLSNPIKCDPTIWNKRVSTFPTTEADFQNLVSRNKAFVESCRQKSGPLLEHMDSMHVAKDIELVRQALDDGKMNFLGQSYGTIIGAAYAELFPEHVGRMVLDGVTDHSFSEIAALTSATATYEMTLNKFFQWCNTTTTCALHGKDVAGIFDAVIETASKTPIPAPGCSPTGEGACRSDVNAEEILTTIKNSISGFEQTWPGVSLAIAQAAQGNAHDLSAPLFNEASSPLFSALTIFCQDWTQKSKSIDDMTLQTQMMGVLAPHSKGMSQSWNLYAGCIGWPAPVTNPQHVLDDRIKDAPPILLVNSLWDASTSIDWANGVKLQIPSSVLIVRNGVGHTSYQTYGKTSAAMDAFLVNGTLPSQGTTYDS